MKYILIAFIFCACQFSAKRETPPISTEPLDTVQFKPARIDAKPALFETAFIKGTTEKINNYTLDLYGVTIGKLKVASGRIIACDPFLREEYGKPFTQVFPTGEFPVQLSIAKLDDGESVVFARIKFSDEPVARWEFALLKGQDSIPVGGKKMHGYVVDAGLGMFMDKEASNALDTAVTNLDKELNKEMNRYYRNNWRYVMYDFGAHNVSVFSAGLGDGRYASYVGFDVEGKVCRLVTDFGLFEWRGK